MHRIGEVLQQVNVHVETDDERFILWPEGFLEKVAANLFFHLQHAFLAATGVNQNPQRKGQIRLRREIFDGLRLAILKQLEVVLAQAGYQPAAFIFDVEE
jgi:hypothetical protein